MSTYTKRTLCFNDYTQRSRRDTIRRDTVQMTEKGGRDIGRSENLRRLHPRETCECSESPRIVSRHARTYSMGELTRMSPWKFPLSSIGPVFTVLFAVNLLPVNSLTSHSLGASAEFLLLAPALRSPGPVSSPSISPLHLDGPPTRTGTSKRSFAARDTRVNIHAPAVVAFRCIFTPESSLPRCIFIRRE